MTAFLIEIFLHRFLLLARAFTEIIKSILSRLLAALSKDKNKKPVSIIANVHRKYMKESLTFHRTKRGRNEATEVKY
jgi:hypothetical protein